MEQSIDTNNLSELKLLLLEIFSWFHKFCVENNIKYYAIGGTMLGAVRHQGFIPWDDDIDVGIPREDYNKLCMILKNKNGRYILETPYSEKNDFCYPYSKIYDTNTTLIENYNPPLKRGIFIDVFPLDGIGDNKKSAEKNFKSISLLYNFYIARVAAIRPERKFYKNILIYAARLIPQFLLNNSKLRIEIDKKCQKYSYKDNDWVANLVGNWGLKELIPKKVLGDVTIYKFENIEIYGVEFADEYLSYIYGDWRKLPPAEKRITHHDFLKLDLKNPYDKVKG